MAQGCTTWSRAWTRGSLEELRLDSENTLVSRYLPSRDSREPRHDPATSLSRPSCDSEELLPDPASGIVAIPSNSWSRLEGLWHDLTTDLKVASV
jgi:hypothetical protein